MPDAYELHVPSLESPLANGYAVTPNDGTDVAFTTRGVWVGGAGDLSVVMAGPLASVLTFTGIPAGTLMPLRVNRVRATGTTATGIIGLY